MEKVTVPDWDVVQLDPGTAAVWLEPGIDNTQSNSALEIYFQLPGRDTWDWKQDRLANLVVYETRSCSVEIPKITSSSHSTLGNLSVCASNFNLQLPCRTGLAEESYCTCLKTWCTSLCMTNCVLSSSWVTVLGATYEKLRHKWVLFQPFSLVIQDLSGAQPRKRCKKRLMTNCNGYGLAMASHGIAIQTVVKLCWCGSTPFNFHQFSLRTPLECKATLNLSIVLATFQGVPIKP